MYIYIYILKNIKTIMKTVLKNRTTMKKDSKTISNNIKKK